MVRRHAHNVEHAGSNPAPATNFNNLRTRLMEVTITERETDMAAALGSLGATIWAERATDARTGQVVEYFRLSALAGRYATQDLRMKMRKGELAPGHLLRRFFLGYGNRNVVLDVLKQGGSMRLEADAADGWRVVKSGAGLPGIEGVAVFKTGNLKLFVALMTAGYAPRRIEGTAGSFSFYVEAQGPEGFAPDLWTRYRADARALPDESIFGAVYQALVNREELIKGLGHGHDRVIVGKKGTRRQVILNAEANGKGWDAARRFLLG